MITSPEILTKVRTFGVFKYPVDKIVLLLNILPEQTGDFLEEFENKSSALRRHYEQGVVMGEHNISIALMKKAEEGDVFAVQQLEDLIENRAVDNLRKELFGV